MSTSTRSTRTPSCDRVESASRRPSGVISTTSCPARASPAPGRRRGPPCRRRGWAETPTTASGRARAATIVAGSARRAASRRQTDDERPWHPIPSLARMIFDRLDADLRPVATASAAVGVVVGVFGAGVRRRRPSRRVASVLQACVMSLLVFTGASQFSAVSVVAAGGTTASALSSSMLLAARNGVYGLTMARVLDGSLAAPSGRRAARDRRDDGDGDSSGRRRRQQATAFWVTGLCVYVFWNLGTLVGALVGSSIDPERCGLDAALPAGFVAMVAPQFRTRERPAGWRCSVPSSAWCTIPFVPIGVSILCASVAVLVGCVRNERASAPVTLDARARARRPAPTLQGDRAGRDRRPSAAAARRAMPGVDPGRADLGA